MQTGWWPSTASAAPSDIADYPVLAPVELTADVRRVPSVPEMLQQQESLRGIIESISSELELRPLNDPSRLSIEILGGGYRELLSGVHYLPVAQGIMGAAVRERRVQQVDDVHADPRYVPTPGAENIEAELAVPILLRNEALGVLNIEGETPFTDDDVSSLRLVATTWLWRSRIRGCSPAPSGGRRSMEDGAIRAADQPRRMSARSALQAASAW